MAANPEVLKQHLIDPEICIRCNTCEETCPVDAITHNYDNYIVDSTNLREAVEQLRGVAANQVAGAEVALVTGGPASLPVSGLILRN